MTNPSPPEPPRQPVPLEPLTSELNLRPSSGLPWAIILLVLGGGAWLFVSGRLPLGPIPDGAAKIPEMQETANTNAAFSQAEERRVVQGNWETLQVRVLSAKKQLDSLAQVLGELAQRRQELEQSEEGRRLAANEELVNQFAALTTAARPDPDQLRLWQNELDRLVNSCTEAIQNETLLLDPAEKTQESATVVAKAVSDALTTVRNDLAAVNAIARGATGNQPAPMTLAEAVATRDQRYQAQRAAEFAKKQAKIQQETDAQNLALDLKEEQRRLDDELAQKQIENERKAMEAQAKTAREQAVLRDAKEKIAAERAYQEKLKKFDKALPEIKSLLSPMISQGSMQIGGAGWTPGEKGPVSLAALQKNRILDLGDNGVYYVSGLFCGPSCRNDRPRGGFPESFTSNETKIRRAQELLVEFGDVMVEKGLLRP